MERSRRVRVTYHGEPYWLDLGRCRQALVTAEVEGCFVGLAGLANLVGVSRSTVSRVFHGQPHSTDVLRRLLAALRLDQGDVLTPAIEDRDGGA
jgi:transcriptional regulator with XRE-family HTH domain